jgi:hypothetical protein
MHSFRLLAVSGAIVGIVFCAVSGLPCYGTTVTADSAKQGGRRTAEREGASHEDKAETAARMWLGSLARNSETGLRQVTQFPFQFVASSAGAKCNKTADDVKAFAGLVRCLEKNETVFLKELRDAGELRIKTIDRGKIPPQLADLVGKVAPREQIVSTFINGDGVTFEMVMLVASGDATAVRAIYINAEFESG